MPKAITLSCTAACLLAAGAAAFVVGAPVVRAAQSAASAPIPIRATDLVPTPNPSLAFDAMAQAMGLFAKHGLKYEAGPKLGGGGPARVQAVATGATDVATSDIISAFGGIYSGADLRILMVMTPYGDEAIWARNKYKSMKEAVGQSWAVASLAGAQRFNAQMTVEGLGFKPDAFRFVAIAGADGPRLEAVDTGRTQLASVSQLGSVLAEAKGYTKQIHIVVAHTAKFTPPIPRLVIIAKESWIKSHEQAATRYVETMLDAGRQWEHSASSWIDPAQKIYKNGGLTPAELRDAWSEFRAGGYFTINGGVNFAATKNIMKLFFKIRNESPNRYLSKPSDVYDTGPLQAALDKMGLAKGTPGLPDNPDWYHHNGVAKK